MSTFYRMWPSWRRSIFSPLHSLCLAAQVCKSARPRALSGFSVIPLLFGGPPDPLWMQAGTVGLGQSTWGKAAWNNGPFLSTPTHTLLTQPSELRKQKTFLPTTSSKSVSLSGLQLPQLTMKWGGLHLISKNRSHKSLFLGQHQFK